MSSNLRLGGTLAAVVLTLAACAGPAASPTVKPSAAPSSAPSSAPSGTPAGSPTGAAPSPTPTLPPPVVACAGGGTGGTLTGEVTLWHSYGSGAGTESDALAHALQVICAENPALKVNVVGVGFGDLFNAYKNQASSGTPDLFVAPNDSLWDLADAGLLQDVSDKIDQTKFSTLAINGSKYTTSDAAVDPGVTGIWQVPESLKAVALYYNKDKVATPPATTDDLMTAVQAGKKLGLVQGSYHEFGWWGAFGGKLMDDSGKCIADQGGVADAYKYLQDLKAAGATFYPKYDDLAAAFKAGDLDMIVDGPWAAGGYLKDVHNLGVAPMPAGPAGPALPLTGVDGYNINPFGTHMDLGIALANRLTQPDIQKIYADEAYHIPARTDVPPSSNSVSAEFAAAVSNGFLRPQTPKLGGFWSNFDAALNSVIDESKNPTEAVATACAAMNTANGF